MRTLLALLTISVVSWLRRPGGPARCASQCLTRLWRWDLPFFTARWAPAPRAGLVWSRCRSRSQSSSMQAVAAGLMGAPARVGQPRAAMRRGPLAYARGDMLGHRRGEVVAHHVGKGLRRPARLRRCHARQLGGEGLLGAAGRRARRAAARETSRSAAPQPSAGRRARRARGLQLVVSSISKLHAQGRRKKAFGRVAQARRQLGDARRVSARRGGRQRRGGGRRGGRGRRAIRGRR